MKTYHIIFAIAMASVSCAQSPKATDSQKEQLRKHFDKDGDGKLNEQEKAAAREAFIKRFDKNGDGKLDASERRAAKNARNQ